MNMHRILTPAIALAALSLVSAKADTLALWTFESSIPTTVGPFAPESGLQTATALGLLVNVGATANGISNPTGNGSTESFSSNGWDVGDYFQFSINTLNYQNIIVSYDQMGSNTGPSSFHLEYSLDGNSFTTFGSSYSVINDAWSSATSKPTSSYSFDLSSITSLNSASSVYFRIVDDSTIAITGGTVALAGTGRIDNFMVVGTAIAPVPEPSTLTLASLGGIACLFALRRKK